MRSRIATETQPESGLPSASGRGCAARWEYSRGGRGEKAWRKWVSWELLAWVTHWKCNPSVVHYGTNMKYRGTIEATPSQARETLEREYAGKLSKN